MAIKALLVHLDDAAAATQRLAAGLALGRAFGAEVTALCLVAEPFAPTLVGRHLPAELAREHLARLEQEADALLAAAREEASRQGVAITTRREIGPLDRLPAILARHGRHADLVLVGQPDLASSGADEALLAEAAFMDTGRPALVLPPAGSAALPPRRAVVAWDGSREAARAAGDAKPLLQQAEDVVVLVIDPERMPARFGNPPGAGLTAYLRRHGVPARPKTVTGGWRSPAEVMLDQAREEAADLLVMGGYGHSRFREMMLGGVTRHLLEHAPVPVLFAH